MPLTKLDKFLEDVISHIRYPFVRDDIKLELESHILDKINYYMDKGYNKKEAEELSIKDMGDPRVIGIELNKQHNPFLGWVLKITNAIVIFFIVINVYFLGADFFMYLFSRNSIKDIPKESIVYKINIDEKVKIDDRVIKFTDIVYEKNGDMNIFYEYWNTKLLGTGWSLGHIGNIKDNLGNTYLTGSGARSGSIKAKGRRTLRDFSEEADTLIIDYDQYNRKYRVEIPLESGDNNE